MSSKEETLDEIRAYLDESDPDAVAFVAADEDGFSTSLVGDDDEIAPEYLLGAFINQLATLRGEHPEDTATKGLRAAHRLESAAEGSMLIDRSD